MKLTKISLVAALLIGSSTFAFENTKVTGDAKLFYATTDTVDLFDQQSSAGQAAVDLRLTTDLSKDVKAGVSTTVLNTLGLENNLVSNVWEGNTATAWWTSEAWLATKVGETDVKVGRQAIDTPLAFTQKNSIAENTYDSVLLVNNDIENTTVVGAYLGQTNTGGTGYGSVVNVNPAGDSFVNDLGSYALGLVNTSVAGLSAQAWYYNLSGIANDSSAFWLQADYDAKEIVPALSLGAQYANISAGSLKASTAMAMKVAYTVDDALSVSAAYSTADKDGTSGAIQNIGATQSKLYTEAQWTFGFVGRAGNDTINVGAKYSTKDIGDLKVSYTASSSDTAANEMTEIAASVTRSYGNLDTAVALINAEVGGANAVNTAQVRLTYNF